MQPQSTSGAMPTGAVTLALALLAVLVVPFANAHAQSTASIEVEGNRRVEAATIRSYFQAAAGDGSDAAALDAGLKALLATGLFETVKIDRSHAQTVIRVSEAPRLGRVAFEGNKKVQDKELGAAVQSKPGGTLQRPLVQADAERIKEVYRRSGRDDVRVLPLTISRGGDRIDLVFEVVE